MDRLSYWLVIGFLYPLSKLPFAALYFLSDFAYYIIYYLVRYRRKVVTQNLSRAFPEKTEQEITAIAKKFYSSFCDIIIENVKFLTISATELERRFQITNHEVVDELYEQRRSAITTLGHMGNWEMAGLNASHTVGHHSLAIYKPLKNKHFDALARKMRARFGMELVAQNRMRHLLNTLDKEACLFHFITDQTPGGKAPSHWMTFMNQEAPIYLGTERVAKMTNLPVFYCHILRQKRGYYTLELKVVTDNPSTCVPNEITERHTQLLEANIREQPESWLWSHRRWKHRKPN
jgi:KDO2-lipid IV(A) lauroyltransferase